MDKYLSSYYPFSLINSLNTMHAIIAPIELIKEAIVKLEYFMIRLKIAEPKAVPVHIKALLSAIIVPRASGFKLVTKTCITANDAPPVPSHIKISTAVINKNDLYNGNVNKEIDNNSRDVRIIFFLPNLSLKNLQSAYQLNYPIRQQSLKYQPLIRIEKSIY